jgi:hypothetical protein
MPNQLDKILTGKTGCSVFFARPTTYNNRGRAGDWFTGVSDTEYIHTLYRWWFRAIKK